MEHIYKWLRELDLKYPAFDPIDWIPQRILNDRAKGIPDTYKTLRQLKDERCVPSAEITPVVMTTVPTIKGII